MYERNMNKNNTRGSTLYLVGELLSLSHAVFPGPHVFNVSSATDSDYLPFVLSDINSDLEKIDEGIYQKIVHLPNIYISKVISGRHHSHIITMEGRVLSYGSNTQGELGCGKVGMLCDSAITGLVRAEVDGAGGGYHSIFLSIDGSVFVNGTNSANQLGIPETDIQSKPVKIPSEYFGGRFISKVSANNTHSVFLTRDSKVYVAGSDSNGCLAGLKTSSVPLLLDFPIQFTPIDVSCGYDDTKFLTNEGVVVGCGCGSHGTTVINDSNGEATNLKYQFEGHSDIIKISNGYFCQSFQTKDLKVHAHEVVEDEFLVNFYSGDYDIYISKEFNPKTKGFGFIKKVNGLDLTGGFKFNDLSEQVGISSQRNHFAIYTFRDDFNSLLKHFLFFEKLLRNDRLPLSDIQFV